MYAILACKCLISRCICLIDVWLDFGQLQISNDERKIFGGKEQGRIRPEIGRISGRIALRILGIRLCSLASIRRDSDVSVTIHVRLRFSFFLFCDFDLFKRACTFRNVLDRFKLTR